MIAVAGWSIVAGMTLASALIALYLAPDRAAWIAVAIMIGAPSAAMLASQPHARRWVRAHRVGLSRALGVAAAILLGLSAYQFRPTDQSVIHFRPTPQPRVFIRDAAWVYLALGSAALLGALALARRAVFPLRPRAVGLGARPRRWHTALAWGGLLMLAALAEINGGIAGIGALEGASPAIQLALLVGGVLALALGLGGIARPAVLPRALGIELALVLTLTLVALIVRGWALGSSVRVLVDEGHFTLGISYVWDFPDLRLLEPMPTVASFPFLYSYLQAGAVELLGRNWAGLRAVSAILGALTIPALYLLARTLYGRVTALTAALVLLSFAPHVHYSRLGLNNIADPLFGTAALALLARGIRTGRRQDFALGGAALGLTQYFYDGGRMLFPALALAWLGGGLIVWRPRPPWRGLLIALVAFLLVAAPVYLTLAGQGFPLFNRLDAAGFNEAHWARHREPDTLATRWTHFKHAAAIVVNSPENTYIYYYLYYGGAHPLVHEALVPLFLAGLVVAAWRWRGPEALPLLWGLGTTLGNAMLVESAVSARFVVAFPALALLIALGLRALLRLVWPLPGRPRLLAGLTVAAALAIAIWQVAFYFGPFLDGFNREVRAHVDYDVDDALLRAQAFPPGTHLVIVGERVLPEIDAQRHLEFLRDDLTVDVMPPAEFADLAFDSLPAEGDLAFFLPPDAAAAIARVRAELGAAGPSASPYALPPEKMLLLYYVPRAE